MSAPKLRAQLGRQWDVMQVAGARSGWHLAAQYDGGRYVFDIVRNPRWGWNLVNGRGEVMGQLLTLDEVVAGMRRLAGDGGAQ
jgi:hypothetical protein